MDRGTKSSQKIACATGNRQHLLVDARGTSVRCYATHIGNKTDGAAAHTGSPPSPRVCCFSRSYGDELPGPTADRIADNRHTRTRGSSALERQRWAKKKSRVPPAHPRSVASRLYSNFLDPIFQQSHICSSSLFWQRCLLIFLDLKLRRSLHTSEIRGRHSRRQQQQAPELCVYRFPWLCTTMPINSSRCNDNNHRGSPVPLFLALLSLNYAPFPTSRMFLSFRALRAEGQRVNSASCRLVRELKNLEKLWALLDFMICAHLPRSLGACVLTWRAPLRPSFPRGRSPNPGSPPPPHRWPPRPLRGAPSPRKIRNRRRFHPPSCTGNPRSRPSYPKNRPR